MTARRACALVAAVVVVVVASACGARTDPGANELASGGAVDSGARPDASVRDAAADGVVHPDAAREAGPPCTRDDQCPLSYGCDPVYGCQARALASAPTGLYEVQLPSCATRLLVASSRQYLDIALAPDRTVYGASSAGLFTVDVNTGTDALVQPAVVVNALDVAPDGTIYGADGDTLYAVDPAKSTVIPVAAFPPGFSSSGDIAFLGGRLLATGTASGATDGLVEFDTTTHLSRLVGSIGSTCVYGLAAFGADLYGMTCRGDVLAIDPVTGKGRRLANVGVTFYGATAR